LKAVEQDSLVTKENLVGLWSVMKNIIKDRPRGTVVAKESGNGYEKKRLKSLCKFIFFCINTS
jgi:hypothetical protein